MSHAHSTADALYRQTSRQTRKNHLVAVIEPALEGAGFRVDFSFGLNMTEAEATADALLNLIVDSSQETGESCPCCAERIDRARQALAILRAGFEPAPAVTH